MWMSTVPASPGSKAVPVGPTQLERMYLEGMKRLTNADHSDDAEGIKLLSAAAAGGLPDAQYNLAVSYERGNGVERDPLKEVEWLGKAAGQGHVDAEYKLASCYRTGTGIGADPAKAFYWYRRAAEHGDAEAQNNVAAAYVHGDGTGKSVSDAARWYERAAANGYARARVSLIFLFLGQTGPDYVSAEQWLILALAVRESLPPAMQQQLDGLQDSIEGRLTFADKKRANDLASDWSRAHPGAGSRPAATSPTR